MSYMKTLDTETTCRNCGGQVWLRPGSYLTECIRCKASTDVAEGAPEPDPEPTPDPEEVA